MWRERSLKWYKIREKRTEGSHRIRGIPQARRKSTINRMKGLKERKSSPETTKKEEGTAKRRKTAEINNKAISRPE